MKKIKWLATVLFVASIALGIIGCSNPSGPSGSGNGGTQEVVVPEMVSVKGATVTGALPAWLNESASDYYKGVFIEGRTVTLSDFYMGKYEVTQEEYASVMKGQKVTVGGTKYTLESNPSYCTKDSNYYPLFSGDVQEKRPVEGVTWYDAVWYCNALSEKEGLAKAYNIEVTQVKQVSGKTGYYIYSAFVKLNKNANGYRLPTEAEWEWLARGGQNYEYAGSDKADDVAWSRTNTDYTGTRDVKTKAPNGYGLYDMSGNVREWCWDKKDVALNDNDKRVLRGGSWGDFYHSCTVYDCFDGFPSTENLSNGFRVVRLAN